MFWEINGKYFEIFEHDGVVVVQWKKWEHMATFLLEKIVNRHMLPFSLDNEHSQSFCVQQMGMITT